MANSKQTAGSRLPRCMALTLRTGACRRAAPRKDRWEAQGLLGLKDERDLLK